MAAADTPKLPTLPALTAELRNLHAAWQHPDAGGEFVALCPGDPGDAEWHLMLGDTVGCKPHGREYVPGSVERECPRCANDPEYAEWCEECNGTGRVHGPSKFDATAAARRLLAAALR
jgi:hypothetical protein